MTRRVLVNLRLIELIIKKSETKYLECVNLIIMNFIPRQEMRLVKQVVRIGLILSPPPPLPPNERSRGSCQPATTDKVTEVE